MRVRTLGALSAAPVDLPSSQSVLSVIRGEPGGWGKVLFSTVLRTILIAPGMWFAGGKGWRLWAGAAASSATITVFLFFWYAAQEAGARSVAVESEPVLSPPGEGAEAATLNGVLGRHPRRV